MNAEKLRAAKIVVTHADCADGVASAIILKDALPKAEVRFVRYGEPGREEMMAEPNMLFCDMTPPEARAREFVDASAIVLDHHVTAKHVVEMFGENGVYMNQSTWSGAMLALDAWALITALNPSRQMQDFAILAGIRDTWQRDSKHWMAACEQQAALVAFPPHRLINTQRERGWIEFDRFIGTVGRGLYEKKMEAVRRAVDKIFFKSIAGLVVAFTSGVGLTSDLAEYLDEKGLSTDILVGVMFEGARDGNVRVTYSMRSHKGFDCGAFAKRQGGGGHKAAAGFSVLCGGSVVMPFTTFESRLQDWA